MWQDWHCGAAKVVEIINIAALINPTTPPLISVSAIDLPAKQKTPEPFPASLSAGFVV